MGNEGSLIQTRWVKTSAAARRLKTSRWTIYRLIAAGTLIWRRYGSLLQVSMDSVEAYERESAPEPHPNHRSP